MTNSRAALAPYFAPLVGARFRPPAQALLNNIPQGTALLLAREPENPYDENAVSVSLRTALIPESRYENLELEAAGFGWELADILAIAVHQLGYIDSKKTGCAKHVSTLLAVDPAHSAWLEFAPDGYPQVAIIFGEIPAEGGGNVAGDESHG